ncbi:hypothetical protein [Nocardioides sp.]|uniref:hypothetical protein n=1 Tax=Nocardioides sp. TaxID=35761 RepID=UPI002ED420E7
MFLRVLALVAGLLGGACWVARWGADLAGDEPTWSDPIYWVGLGLLGLALACAGGGLVSRSATWLRLIVAAAFPLLVWSVYAVVKGDSEAIMLDGVLGAVALVGSLALYSLTGGRRTEDAAPRRRPGSHAR